MIFEVVLLIYAAALIVFRLLTATLPMDDEYWESLKHADVRMFKAIFRMASQPLVIKRVEQQERFYRVLLVILNTTALSWVIYSYVHRVRLDGVEDALANGVGPAIAWLITTHWFRLDLMHSRLEAARRYLQSKGRILQDPP